MKFTPLEILTISEIAGQSELFGLPFAVDIEDNDEFINELKTGLEKKDILKQNTLTEIGVMMALLFEKYNASTKHIFMNRSRLAFDGDSVIAFIKEEDVVDIVRKHKVKAVEDIIMNNAYMRNTQKKSFFKPAPIDCSQETWLEEELDNYPNFLIIQTYEVRELDEHLCLAWSDTGGCCYNYIDRTMIELGPKDLRMLLLRLFEVEVDESGR